MEVNFKLRPLYSRGKSHRCPLDKRLGGPQSRSGRCGEETNLLSLAGIEARPSSPWLYRLRNVAKSLPLHPDADFNSVRESGSSVAAAAAHALHLQEVCNTVRGCDLILWLKLNVSRSETVEELFWITLITANKQIIIDNSFILTS
jgi:hypothetical protein